MPATATAALPRFARAERLAATRRALAPGGIAVAEQARWLERLGIEVVPDFDAAPCGLVSHTEHPLAPVPARLTVYVGGHVAGVVLAMSPLAWAWGTGAERSWLRRTPLAAVLSCAAHHADLADATTPHTAAAL